MAQEIRVVLSDLDDTLFDHRRATRTALALVTGQEPAFASQPFDELERRHRRLLDALHLEILDGRRTVDEARVERFRRLLEAASAERAEVRAIDIAQAYRQAYAQACYPVAGAVELAAAIKRAGLSLVIVTNNIAVEQRQKLERCALAAYVDVLVTSEEVGISKPGGGIFQAALDAVGATAAEAVMVGDAWSTDITGARGVGVRAIWFNRFDEDSPDPSVPELRSLEPVADALSVIQRA